MKHLLILLLSFCAFTASAQTDNVTRHKPATPASKPKPATPAKPAAKAKPKPAPAKTAPKVTASYANGVLTVGRATYNFVYVEGGTFTMGTTPDQQNHPYDEKNPTHSVTLTSYMIGQTEVTQELWQAVMGKSLQQIVNENGWSTCGVGNNYPMYDISWNDCQDFIRKLNSLTGQTFRLPTEAEWEFAARGGNKSKMYMYSGSNNLGDVAWYEDNSGETTYPVAMKAPNELGIYDMSGNVWEWCQDWYGRYSSSPQTNPQGPNSGSDRVIRGGSRGVKASCCRASERDYNSPTARFNNLGLRLAL